MFYETFTGYITEPSSDTILSYILHSVTSMTLKLTVHGHRSWVNRICVRLRRECVLIHKLDCHVLSSSIWTTIEKQNLKGNYQMTNTKLNVITKMYSNIYIKYIKYKYK